MSGGQMKTPARGQAQPGQEGRLATAAGFLKVAQSTLERQAYRLHLTHGLTEASVNALAALVWVGGK